MELRIFAVFCLLGASALGAPEKAPAVASGGGYDQQVVGQGYNKAVFQATPETNAHKAVPSPSYGAVGQGVGGESSSGGAHAAAGGSYAYEYNTGNSGNQGKELGFVAGNSFGPTSFSAGSGHGGYGPPPPNVDSSYGPPSSSGVIGGNYAPGSSGYGPESAQGPSYTYHYTHYPNVNRPHSISPGDEGGFSSIFDSLTGGFEGGAGSLAGLGGGLGGLGGLIAIGKGILALKPLFLLGLFILIGIPLLLLFLPIPIISVSGLPGFGRPSGDSGSRQAYGQSMLSTYISTLSDRVLNSEECLERLICKIPNVPGKFQGKAKLLWEQYGKKYITSSRVQRALTAFFDEAQGRSRVSKCNQKFKCSNKYF